MRARARSIIMPLKALVEGTPFYAKELKEADRRKLFVCPICKEPFIAVIPVTGIIKHFRHKSGKTHGGEPETETHLLMKQWIKEEAEKLGLQCELEVHIPLNSKLHIADAVIQGPQQKIVVEAQCSSISIRSYRERTEFYQDNDYQIIWILGGKLCKEPYKKMFFTYKRNKLEQNIMKEFYNIYYYDKGKRFYAVYDQEKRTNSLKQIIQKTTMKYLTTIDQKKIERLTYQTRGTGIRNRSQRRELTQSEAIKDVGGLRSRLRRDLYLNCAYGGCRFLINESCEGCKYEKNTIVKRTAR